MKHCPNRECPYREQLGSIAEYQDEIELCTDCGTRLENGPPPEEDEPSPTTDAEADDLVADDLVTVANYPNAHEAQLARAMLESEQVPAVVQHDHSPFVSAAAWVAVAVPKHHVDLAQRILEEIPKDATRETVQPEEGEDEWMEQEVRRRKIGRAARWVAFLAILFTGAGTFLGFAQRTLVGEVRMDLASFSDYSVVPDHVLMSIRFERGIDLLSDGPQTAGELRSMLDAMTVGVFMTYYIIAAIYVALYFWARRSPVAALIVALCVYLVVLVLEIMTDPATLFQGILMKILIIGFLVAGVRAALSEADERERLKPVTAQGD